MAADGLNRVRIKLVECDKIQWVVVELPYEQAGDVLTVWHMSQAFERATGIPMCNQRIIFKGKDVCHMTTSLLRYGIGDCSEVHLLKRQLRLPDCGVMAKLDEEEKCISEQNKVLSHFISECDGIHRGIYPYQFHLRHFMALRAQFKQIAANLEQSQARLNVLDLTKCEDEVKDKRRHLSKWIETLQYRIEGMDMGLRDVIARLEEEGGMNMPLAFPHSYC